MNRLSLWVPGLRDMAYRQQLLADPATMAYNAGRDLGGAEGYDPATGCIAFPREDWRYWRGVWLHNEPQFFSALLREEAADRFVGEVTYFYDAEARCHGAGILIEAAHRGRGLCAPALRLLADHAFAREEVSALRCELPKDSAAAVRGYCRAGFHAFGESNGALHMLLTREDWEREATEHGEL